MSPFKAADAIYCYIGTLTTPPPPVRDEIDQEELKEIDYSYPTLSPYFSIETNRENLHSHSVPAVGIPPVTSKKKIKINNYDSNNKDRRGYEYDNQRILFLDDVSGEEDFDDDKDLPGNMVGEGRDGNETRDEAVKLVLLSVSEID